MEPSGLEIPNGAAAVRVVRDYFGSTTVATEVRTGSANRERVDLALRFGSHTVLVEVKVVPPGRMDTEQWLEGATNQVARFLTASQFSRAAVVVFSRSPVPEAYRAARPAAEGRVSLVVIEVSGAARDE